MKRRHFLSRLALGAAALGVPRLWPSAAAAESSTTFFDGMDEVARPVMADARRRIEQIRKADWTIRFLKPDGSPATGPADIQLKRHQFAFGANLTGVSAHLAPDSPVRSRALGMIEEVFNFARVGNFWSNMAPTKDGPLDWERVDRDVKWAQDRDMPMRFHCLIYTVTDALPTWHADVKSTDEWWLLIEGRIRATAERYGRVIHEYDVINEMVDNPEGKRRACPLFPQLVDPENGARIVRLARKYLPDAALVSTEERIITTAPTNLHAKQVVQYQKALLDLGAPVDVIGFQGHYHHPDDFHHPDSWTFQQGTPEAGPEAYMMKGVSDGLDWLATLGKPIHITEFTGPSRVQAGSPGGLTPEEEAAWVVNFYTLAFSKPYIEELVSWNVIDGVGGRAVDAGMLTKKGEEKPLYFALKKLLMEDWTSRWSGSLANGAAAFRGFYGTYEAKVGNYPPVKFQAHAKGGGEIIVRLAS